MILLSLLLPILIASAIVFFEFQNLRTIYKKVNLIEIADDINLTLLELRRYEKNILLFKEEQNLKIFYENLELLKKKVHRMENEIVSDLSRINYKSLLEDIELYEKSASVLGSNVKEEQKLIEDIRPLGRVIEKEALHKELALELRRWEKNYIIYNEQEAVKKLHRIANELIKTQPTLSIPVGLYLKVFDSLTETESFKENSSRKIRHYAREIEKITMDLSRKKREDIDKIISAAKMSFIVSFIFLIGSTCIIVYLFSSNMVKTLKTIESSFGRLKAGDYTFGIDIKTNRASEEIISFVDAYNQTIEDLRVSRVELEHTFKKLGDANRELIERQDELVEARKVTAMRLLASEIAHEINNPLSSLTTFLGMFYEEIPATDPRRETLTLMLKETGRCRLVLRELVDFARKEPLQLREVAPRRLLNEAIEVALRQNSEKGINLTASLDGLPERVVLDPILIHQALVNILTNAYQFTSSGGNIAVDGYADGNNMVITVKDTGVGIAEEDLPRIFEPFFSTRKDIGGSGLGLAITKKIIESHNGSIQVESKLNEETVFKIKLPIKA